jgi:hypothetical protein
LWSVDLGTDGDFQRRLSVSEVLLSPPSVNYLNDSQIICAFYDREKIGFDPSLTVPTFYVLEIDAHTGALGRKLSFRSIDDRSRALPVADGGFVVLAAQELEKFDSRFLPGQSLATSIGGTRQTPGIWLVDVTPGGTEVALYARRGGTSLFEWLRSDDLSLLASLPTSVNWTIQASNTGVTTYKDQHLDIVSKSGSVLLSCLYCIPHFLTDDLLFVDRGFVDTGIHRQGSYSIETISGEKQASGRLDHGAGDFTRAANSSRLAYLSGHFRSSGFPIQTHFDSLTGKITVLDWTANKRVAEIEVNESAGNPSAGLTQSALALSPDGKYLLVLLHHTLTCYRLP